MPPRARWFIAPWSCSCGRRRAPDARSPRPWRSWTGRFPRSLGGPEYGSLALGDEEREEFCADAERLVRNYFALENPGAVRVLGTELRLSVSIGTLTLSGIIDRLDLDADGGLVVTDYKTGRAPSIQREQSRLGGVHFYAFLCEQVLGQRPARVQLLHLREPLAISAVPSDQSIQGQRQQIIAIWSAVEQACVREDFRPKPGWLCDHCAYHEYCPAVGGDLTRVPVRTPGVVEGDRAAPPLRAAGGSARPAPSAVAAVGP